MARPGHSPPGPARPAVPRPAGPHPPLHRGRGPAQAAAGGGPAGGLLALRPAAHHPRGGAGAPGRPSHRTITEGAMTDRFHRFTGTDRYLTSPALQAAVNCALALERPLLVKGEPGTGKQLLAE